MKVQTLQFVDINPAEYNPRTISDKNLEGLKHSITKFGQVANLVVNKDGTLISGHQRMRAMMELGYTEAKCFVVDLSVPDEKRLNILMNSKTAQGEFDELKLSEMIEELKGVEDYEKLLINEIEPLDISDVIFGDGTEDDGGSSGGGGADLFVKKIVINLSDKKLAETLRKLDKLGADPSELYERLLNQKFQIELSGE